MNIRQMPLEELELLSYTDIAYEILKEDKKPKTTPELFKEVCSLLNINEDQMMDMIGDFYTNLTTDKRFILLDDAKWDIFTHDFDQLGLKTWCEMPLYHFIKGHAIDVFIKAVSACRFR